METIGNPDNYDHLQEQIKLQGQDNSRPKHGYTEERLHKVENKIVEIQDTLYNRGKCLACKGLIGKLGDFPMCKECLDSIGTMTINRRNKWTLK